MEAYGTTVARQENRVQSFDKALFLEQALRSWLESRTLQGEILVEKNSLHKSPNNTFFHYNRMAKSGFFLRVSASGLLYYRVSHCVASCRL